MTLEEMQATYEKLKPLNQQDNWEYPFLQIIQYNLLVIEKAMFTIEKTYSVFPKHEGD